MHGSGLLRMDDFKRMKSMERSMQLCQLTLYASKQTKLSPLLLCKRVQPFRICWSCMYIKWHAYVRRSFSCHAWYVKQLLRNDFAGQHWNPFGYGSQCQPCSWWDWRWWKRYWRWTTQISGYPVTCEHPKFQHFNMHGITWIQLIYKDISLKIGSMHGFFLCLLCVNVLKNYLRKGPLERVPFPTLSQTQSPFQQLGHHLLLLGKKIDAAQLSKDHAMRFVFMMS